MSDLLRLKRWVALGAAFALLVALHSAYSIGLMPPSLHKKTVSFGSAREQVLVDTPQSSVINLGPSTTATSATPDFIGTLQARASLLASLLTSAPVKQLIGQAAGVPASVIQASAPSTSATPPAGTGGTVTATAAPAVNPNSYVLVALADPTLPMVTIAAQAPSAAAARRLADAAVTGLKQYVTQVGAAEGISGLQRVVVTPLGPATGSLVTTGGSNKTAAILFVVMFALSCVTVLATARFRRRRQFNSFESQFAGDAVVLDPPLRLQPDAVTADHRLDASA